MREDWFGWLRLYPKIARSLCVTCQHRTAIRGFYCLICYAKLLKEHEIVRRARISHQGISLLTQESNALRHIALPRFLLNPLRVFRPHK
jgi:hypothetical protein